MPLYPVTVPNIPSEALEALERVQSIDPYAILAGGVLRDTLFGKEVKDIDIFVGPDVTQEALQAALPNHWVDREFVPADMQGTAYGRGFGERVLVVYEAYHKDHVEPQVQVIVRRDPIVLDEVLADFDWSFCQIGKWNAIKNGMCYATHAFRLSMNDGPIFNMLPIGDPRVEYSINRGHRLAEKYPDRTFYVPMKKTVDAWSFDALLGDA